MKWLAWIVVLAILTALVPPAGAIGWPALVIWYLLAKRAEQIEDRVAELEERDDDDFSDDSS